jgi:hypothetical protein
VKFFTAVMPTHARLHYMQTDTACDDCVSELYAAVHMTAMVTCGKL